MTLASPTRAHRFVQNRIGRFAPAYGSAVAGGGPRRRWAGAEAWLPPARAAGARRDVDMATTGVTRDSDGVGTTTSPRRRRTRRRPPRGRRGVCAALAHGCSVGRCCARAAGGRIAGDLAWERRGLRGRGLAARESRRTRAPSTFTRPSGRTATPARTPKTRRPHSPPPQQSDQRPSKPTRDAEDFMRLPPSSPSSAAAPTPPPPPRSVGPPRTVPYALPNASSARRLPSMSIIAQDLAANALVRSLAKPDAVAVSRFFAPPGIGSWRQACRCRPAAICSRRICIVHSESLRSRARRASPSSSSVLAAVSEAGAPAAVAVVVEAVDAAPCPAISMALASAMPVAVPPALKVTNGRRPVYDDHLVVEPRRRATASAAIVAISALSALGVSPRARRRGSDAAPTA